MPVSSTREPNLHILLVTSPLVVCPLPSSYPPRCSFSSFLPRFPSQPPSPLSPSNPKPLFTSRVVPPPAPRCWACCGVEWRGVPYSSQAPIRSDLEETYQFVASRSLRESLCNTVPPWPARTVLTGLGTSSLPHPPFYLGSPESST